MRVIITGHTSGIGLAFFNHYQQKGYDVQGFSRSNGYDIANKDSLCAILAKVSKECDLFINNAYHDDVQLKIMKIVDTLWYNDSSKKHVVIGSRAADIPIANINYNNNKKDIDLLGIELQKQAKYHLMIVKPGRVDTPGLHRVRKSSIIKPMITAKTLVEMVDNLIHNDIRVMSVTLEPNRS